MIGGLIMTDTSPANLEAQSKDVSGGNVQFLGGLVSKNIRIHDRRTSVRLEPEMWDALKEVASIEGCSIHDLCGAVDDMKAEGASFTGALRVFLMEYFRAAAKTSPQVGMVQRRLNMAPAKTAASR